MPVRPAGSRRRPGGGALDRADQADDGGTEDLAGVSLLRFAPDGLVVEHRDFWNLR
jgi:hypothetical protein